MKKQGTCTKTFLMIRSLEHVAICSPLELCSLRATTCAERGEEGQLRSILP